MERKGANAFLKFKTAHLLFFTDVATEVSCHLFHGFLRYDGQPSISNLLQTRSFFAILIVRVYVNKWPIIALDMRTASGDVRRQS